ncbi:Uncharacterised protein [Chlamydia trachomatis]|nr:Uncharacterised protein [Chlamydia trachomatis]
MGGCARVSYVRISALTLLVPGVVADDHDIAVATNHLALVTNLLDTRLDLHGYSSTVRRRSCRGLLVAVDDTASGEVVGAQFDENSILGEDSNVVLSHLSCDVTEHNVPIGQFHTEHRVRQGLNDRAFHFDDAVFLCHILRLSSTFFG